MSTLCNCYREDNCYNLVVKFAFFGGREIACMDISGFIPEKALCKLL